MQTSKEDIKERYEKTLNQIKTITDLQMKEILASVSATLDENRRQQNMDKTKKQIEKQLKSVQEEVDKIIKGASKNFDKKLSEPELANKLNESFRQVNEKLVALMTKNAQQIEKILKEATSQETINKAQKNIQSGFQVIQAESTKGLEFVNTIMTNLKNFP